MTGTPVMFLMATTTVLGATIRFSDAPTESPSLNVALLNVTDDAKAELVDSKALPVGDSYPPNGVSELMDQLREQRKTLHRQLHQFHDPEYSLDRQLTLDEPFIKDARRMLEQSDRSRISEYLRISQQLDKLESILIQRRQAATVSQPPIAPETAPITPEPEPTVREDSEKTESVSEDVDIPKSPVAVLDRAIDSLQLADNLFGAGQYETALNICQNIDRKKLDDYENAWLHYQIASCQRKLGVIPQAEKHYRVVAGHAGSEHLSDYARWWLDSIETVKTFEQSLEQLNLSIKTVRQGL